MKLIFFPFVAVIAIVSGCTLEYVTPHGMNVGATPLEAWTADYATTSSKVKDWVACGGTPSGGIPSATGQQLQEQWRPGDKSLMEAEQRVRGKVGECMKLKGYRLTEEYDHAAWQAGQRAAGRTD